MSDDALGGWLFFVYWMVPNIAAAVFAWRITDPPRTRGWEATKAFFQMAALIILFGIAHTFFWMFVIGAPFDWAFDKVDRHFGGAGMSKKP